MTKERQLNGNDTRRGDAFQRSVYEQSGGLSESMIQTPEESRKAALLRKVREQGY